MEDLGKIFVAIIFSIVGALMSGWLLAKFWLWFILPIFDVREIRIVEAIGIIIFASLFQSTKSKDDEYLFDKIVLYFVKFGLILLFGYIVKCFM